MTKIYRYEINGRQTTLSMPAGAVVISASPARDHINLYALCDLSAGPEDRHFLCAVTGDELPGFIWDCIHIATLPGGAHLFEVPSHHVQAA